MNIHSANVSLAKPLAAVRQSKANAEEIKFATGKSELGTVLVARSAAGVCAILIGDRAEALKGDLAEEFMDAKLVRDDRALRTDLAGMNIQLRPGKPSSMQAGKRHAGRRNECPLARRPE